MYEIDEGKGMQGFAPISDPPIRLPNGALVKLQHNLFRNELRSVITVSTIDHDCDYTANVMKAIQHVFLAKPVTPSLAERQVVKPTPIHAPAHHYALEKVAT